MNSQNPRSGEPPTAGRSTIRLGALAAVAGVVVQIVASNFHAGHADPNDSAHVFVDYSESSIWTIVHIAQFAGVLLICLGFVAMARTLSNQPGVASTLARWATAAATVVIAVFAVQMAVDGIALRETINTWVHADPASKTAAFYSAESVRWLEKGMSAFFHLTNGTTLLLLGLAVATGRVYPRVVGVIGALSGAAVIAGGVETAHSGFSAQAGVYLGPGLIAGIIFLVAMSFLMWRTYRAPNGRMPAAEPLPA